jgi:prephenate dehydrogenase
MNPEHPVLVVVGAAGGMGRWLCRHLFAGADWDHAVLVDRDSGVHRLEFGLRCPVRTGTVRYSASAEVADEDGRAIELGAAPARVCLAVPQAELPRVAAYLLPELHPGSVVFDTSSAKVAALATLRAARHDVAVFGIHPLFGPTVASMDGQTVVVCPSSAAPTAHEWLAVLVSAAGGIIELASPEEHDRIMAYVQSASHQALLAFADVVANSGHDIEGELWKLRTPVFETLLGLASRVLSPGQEETTASIELTTEGARVAAEFDLAQDRLRSALRTDDAQSIASYIASTREAFGGTFFTTLQQVSNLAVEATQVTRTRLAERRRTGEIVALEHHGAGGVPRLVVGRIREITPTTVTVEELLIGTKGHAVLADGSGLANAPRLGVSVGAKRRVVRFGFAHVTVVTATELDRILDEWLGRISIDVRVLVPESIAGTAVTAVCRSVAGVDAASLVTEAVRLGQREVVVRIQVRADRDPGEVAGFVAGRVDEAYGWPAGIVAPLADARVRAVAYLGPAGTFSEIAARQAAGIVGRPDAALVACAGFEAVIAAVVAGDAELAVLPIVNSASGLVELAAAGLLASRQLVAGGVIDVSVRFDAYAATDDLAALGARPVVYSHPQAIQQCSHYINRLGWEAVACDSTAAACGRAARDRDGVAIAARGQADPHGLVTVARDVGDLSGVLTRFLVLGPAGAFAAEAAEGDPTYRWLWLTETDEKLEPSKRSEGGARFDEIVVGGSHVALVVTTSPRRPGPKAKTLALGHLPWSPRTPVVRVQ